jgi:integrase
VRGLPSGRWQLRYTGPDGTKRPGERTFATKTEAMQELARIEADLTRGKWTDPHLRKVLLAPYMEQWLANNKERLAIRTFENYQDLLRLHIKPQIGGFPIGKITPEEVERWHNGRLASTGTTRAYRFLRTVLNQAVRQGLLPVSPCQVKGGGKVVRTDRPYFPPEAVDAIVAELPEQMKTAVIVTTLAHLRKGELLGLRYGDVDFAREKLKVEQTLIVTKSGVKVKSTPKSGKTRVIDLPPEAVEALRAHFAAHPGLPAAPLFTRENGERLLAWHVDTAWEKARAAAGLEEYHFHDLRHAGLTWFAQLGGTIAEIRERGGHSSNDMAIWYQHAAEERLKKLAAGLTIKGAKTTSEDSAAQ